MKASELTIAFVGCGNMGSAVLQGLLDTVFPERSKDPISKMLAKFIACTNTEKSARTLENNLGRHVSQVRVLYRQNQAAFDEADVIVLGVKPYVAKDVLQEPGVYESISGKLVISMIAGISVTDVTNIIKETAGSSDKPMPYIAKAIPNLAAQYRQSMTILELSDPALPPKQLALLEWIFNQVGRVKLMSPSLVDVGSVLVTTCLATLSVPLDGLLDGSVVEGLRRQEALELAVQGVIGLGTMLQNGHHPAILRENISSPRGCTIQTLLVVERKGARAVFADALLSGASHLKRPSKSSD
ncbi:hypothetical protein AK830_g8081 [Neonectria ditissima]|uniref:Pyrroline-5-carboxylate reductase n=1 Tax=Neonectria ditissima TaxID=78410 RepID=A0A0P7B8T7_9HYPO|nr:hypothetical protein AK830_g8081 [Neonectria ditissima]